MIVQVLWPLKKKKEFDTHDLESRPCIGNYCPRDTWQDKCIYIYLFSEKTSQTWHFRSFLSFKIHQVSGLKPLAGRLCPAGHMFDTPAIDHTCQTQGPWPEFGPFIHFKWPTKQFWTNSYHCFEPCPLLGWVRTFVFFLLFLSLKTCGFVCDRLFFQSPKKILSGPKFRITRFGFCGPKTMGSSTLGKAATLDALLHECVEAFGEYIS